MNYSRGYEYVTLICMILFVVVPQTLRAQNDKVVLKLKYGTTLSGRFLNVDDDGVTFMPTPFDTIEVEKRNIRKILYPYQVSVHSNGAYHHNEGLFGNLSLGFTANSYYTIQLDAIIGKKFEGKYALGIGGGFEAGDIDVRGLYLNHEFLTAFGYARYVILDRRGRVFLDGKFGYGFVNENSTDPHEGGLMGQPGIGLLLASKGNFRISLKLSQYIQSTKGNTTQIDSIGNPVFGRYRLTYNRTLLKLGIEFR